MEWWIPKVAPGKKVGGWWRLEDREYVGRFRPNTVEARDRSVDCLSAALFQIGFFFFRFIFDCFIRVI